ncbi:MAG: single-stranded DNA-binding protein [bacterium]
MNNVSLIGRLTKEVEMRYTSANNTAVAGFTLAVNRKIKVDGQPEADFIPIVAWQKTAEFCEKYFKKGQQVFVCGRIQTRTWDDDEGKKHYVTEVIANEVGFADSKKEGSGENGNSQRQEASSSHQNNTLPADNKQQPTGRMPWETVGG